MEEEKINILIVDDEESIRSIIARKLGFDGYNCQVAADGEEALRKASTENFDLVLLDVNMPRLSGMEVLRRFTAEHVDVSVIMITAMADTETRIEALRLGAYDCMAKPFDLDELSTRVKRAIEIRRLVLKNGSRRSELVQNETLMSLIEHIARGELQDACQLREGASKPLTEFAIPTSGYTTNLKVLASDMRTAQNLLLMPDILQTPIGNQEYWRSLLGEDIAKQRRGYNELTRLIGETYIAVKLNSSGKIHIPGPALIESTTSREVGFCESVIRHPCDPQTGIKEALEVFLKMPRGQWDSGFENHFLQKLGQQVMMSQVPINV